MDITATRSIALAAAQVALLALLVGPSGVQAQGSGLQITPISLILEPGQRIGSYTLRNHTDREQVVEASVVPWDHGSADDAIVEADEVLATPPVFTIPPRGEQVVRVGLTMPAPRETEQAYRVRLAALPPEPEPGVTGVAVLTAFLVPMFVEPVSPRRVEPEWRVRLDSDGNGYLAARNPGNVHLRLSDVRITADPEGERELFALSGVHYLLPEELNEWAVEGASQFARGSDVWVHARHRGQVYSAGATVD